MLRKDTLGGGYWAPRPAARSLQYPEHARAILNIASNVQRKVHASKAPTFLAFGAWLNLLNFRPGASHSTAARHTPFPFRKVQKFRRCLDIGLLKAFSSMNFGLNFIWWSSDVQPSFLGHRLRVVLLSLCRIEAISPIKPLQFLRF